MRGVSMKLASSTFDLSQKAEKQMKIETILKQSTCLGPERIFSDMCTVNVLILDICLKRLSVSA